MKWHWGPDYGDAGDSRSQPRILQGQLQVYSGERGGNSVITDWQVSAKTGLWGSLPSGGRCGCSVVLIRSSLFSGALVLCPLIPARLSFLVEASLRLYWIFIPQCFLKHCVLLLELRSNESAQVSGALIPELHSPPRLLLRAVGSSPRFVFLVAPSRCRALTRAHSQDDFHAELHL